MGQTYGARPRPKGIDGKQTQQRKQGPEWLVLQISWVASGRRSKERKRGFVLDDEAIVLHGSACPSAELCAVLEERFQTPTSSIELVDSRAKHLIIARIAHTYWALPSPEAFSRHSGVCMIVGDRRTRASPVELKLGSCLRMGSVGVVVSEVCCRSGELQTLSQEHLQYLKDGAYLWNEDAGDEAKRAADESHTDEEGSQGDNESMNERQERLCYMCYESEDTTDNPLVAPCDCKGDTKFVHVHCLQKWYTTRTSEKSHVIRISAGGAAACKVCGAPYKTILRMADGTKQHLLEPATNGPYISLTVVTRHDTAPTLFSTKFRLCFGSAIGDAPSENVNSLTVGRSSSCDVVLDYRTVSTVHARVSIEGDQFLLHDLASSNGTMMYVRGPVELPYTRSVKLRMGRSTVTLQARRTIRSRLTNIVSKRNTTDVSTMTPDEVMRVLDEVLASCDGTHADRATRMGDQYTLNDETATPTVEHLPDIIDTAAHDDDKAVVPLAGPDVDVEAVEKRRHDDEMGT